MEHLKKISYTDLLTGIYNRLACIDLVSDLIGKGEKFTVVSIDINGFKSINDTMGFDTGNRVLIEIAARWKAIADAKTSDTSTASSNNMGTILLNIMLQRAKIQKK